MEVENKILINLSLVCKDWQNIIVNDTIWIDKMNILLRSRINVEPSDADGHLAESRFSLIRHYFGSVTDLFPPKTVYYLLLPRLERFSNDNIILAQFTADQIRTPKQNIWTPWLNHNVIARPDTLWKFIFTVIRYPSWIYPFFIPGYYEDSSFPFTAKDPFGSYRVNKMLRIIIVSIYVVLLLIERVLKGFSKPDLTYC